jgi:hypothetical protein
MMADQEMGEAPIIKAPWKLHGRGWMLLYRFPRPFVLEHGQLEKDMAQRWRGGWGSVMIVDYESSDAGPYGELLFIPGRFDSSAGRRAAITRIYVSTKSSVENGRRNWAIPKERADFTFLSEGGIDHVRVEKDGEELFSADFKAGGLPFPVSTKILPFPLAQPDGASWRLTDFSGQGIGRIARILKLESRAPFFPPLTGLRPILTVEIRDFNICFPQAGSIARSSGNRA